MGDSFRQFFGLGRDEVGQRIRPGNIAKMDDGDSVREVGIRLLDQEVLHQVFPRLIPEPLRIRAFVTVHAAGFVDQQHEVHPFAGWLPLQSDALFGFADRNF